MKIIIFRIFLIYLMCHVFATVAKGKTSKGKKTGRQTEKEVSPPDTKNQPDQEPNLEFRNPQDTHKYNLNAPPNETVAVFNIYNIKQQLEHIFNSFPDINVTTQVIGKTLGYNDILLSKITQVEQKKYKRFRADENKFTDETPEKKIIFIVHGLSVMGAQYLSCFRRMHSFKLLLSYYVEHLDKFDIFFIPMANPDGFAYVMNDFARTWNKNLSPQSACRGIALDRNFDVAWNSTRAISPCSQQYPGTVPFSEEETKTVREVFQRYGHKIIAYIHVHSGTFDCNTYKGDAVLYPRGFSEVTTDDDKYIDLRGEIDEAIKEANFNHVSVYVDTLYTWYGKIFGSSVDYAATIYGIPYAMEFVMQLYNDKDADCNAPADSRSAEQQVLEDAVEEIWHRVINVTFHNIWKSLNVVEY